MTKIFRIFELGNKSLFENENVRYSLLSSGELQGGSISLIPKICQPFPFISTPVYDCESLEKLRTEIFRKWLFFTIFALFPENFPPPVNYNPHPSQWFSFFFIIIQPPPPLQFHTWE